MPLVYVGIGIVVLLVLMLWLRFDAFFALLLTCFVTGLLNSMAFSEILASILSGVGQTLGNIVLIIVFGAMLGKLVEESGAAHTITNRLTKAFGLKRVQWAILITGFLVGLPMMYNASFLVLIPLIYAFSATTKLPLLYLGIPLSATLSVAHGYLPPHPAPTYVSFVYQADVNRVLMLGLTLVVPACVAGGILLSRFFRHIRVRPPEGLYEERSFSENELPSLGVSVLATLVPVILMLFGAVIDIVFGVKADFDAILSGYGLRPWTVSILGAILKFLKFLSDANMALMISVLAGLYLLGIRRGRKMNDLMKSLGKSVNAIAMIVLIIAAGGAFKQVISDSGVAHYIEQQASGIRFNPLVLAWCVAAILRLAVGSATVATMTAAGIMLPVISGTGVSPELMVLATGSGSLMFSHFNDVGFWMFKEYYNVTVKQTFAIWTVMESIVALVGLGGVLVLNILI